MTAPRARCRQPKQLDAGILQAEINSFALRLAAEGKAAKTIRTYAEAVQWFAAACLAPERPVASRQWPPAGPTEIPQVRVPGRPHKVPTDTTALRGTLRHSC